MPAEEDGDEAPRHERERLLPGSDSSSGSGSGGGQHVGGVLGGGGGGAAAGGGAGVARSLVADYLDVLCTRASRPFALFLALLCSNGVLYASFLPFVRTAASGLPPHCVV